MRILSARIHRVRRDRERDTVSAVVALTALCERRPVRAFVAVAVPARPTGAAPLREDAAVAPLSNADATANAPLKGGGCFKVPLVIER